MTRPPDFDEVVGSDVDPREEARLRNVHEMLLQSWNAQPGTGGWGPIRPT